MLAAIPHEIDPRTFRTAMGRFATGVTVVSTHIAGHIHGMTANAFLSVSLDPPLVLVSIGQTSRMHSLLSLDMPLGVSVLAEDQVALSNHFAGRGDGAQPSWRWENDVPLLKGAIAQIAGHVVALHPAGDHTLVIAHVLHVAHSEGQPLLFHGGRYAQLCG